MNQNPRPSGRGRGGSGGGASEGNEGASAMDIQQSPPKLSQPPPFQQPFDGSLPIQQSPRRQVPWDNGTALGPRPALKKMTLPPAQAASKSGQSIAVSISRPTPIPQWPVGVAENGQEQRSNNGQYQPPSGRGQVPQRPPRPRHVPSMLDASRIQDHTPTFQYKPRPVNVAEQEAHVRERGHNVEEDIAAPVIVAPVTPEPKASPESIPDFPVPAPLGVRRSANLGPPPTSRTSRRGLASYFSNTSYVSPIPEESPRQPSSHQSYASSAAIPMNWEADHPQGDPYDRERNMSVEDDMIEEGHESRGSTGDDGDERGLVRSASIVKKGKPTMVINKTPDKSDSSQKAISGPANGKVTKMGAFGPIEMDAARTNEVESTPAKLSARAGTKVPPQPEQQQTRWPKFGTVKESNSLSEPSSQSATATTPTHGTTISLESRLSRLDPDGSRPYTRGSVIPPADLELNPESRESITSLPELIRRATRLAAMIDKGRRPASRLNTLNDFLGEGDMSRDKNGLGIEEKRRSGLSGMLAAFPPPGLASHNSTQTGTPDRDRSRRTSLWPTYSEDSPKDSDIPKQRRRCCRLPVYVFWFICLAMLILVASAVVLPLEFLVFHKSPAAAATQTPATGCQATTVCDNGGVSSSSGNTCTCICSNGFTGSTCSTVGDAGCTSMNIIGVSTNYKNVTLGFAIPRLIAGAEKNFSIPLVAEVILSQFSAAEVSCSTENALVTFDGLSVRVGLATSPVTSVALGSATAPAVRPRQAYTATGVGTIISRDTATPTTATSPSSPSSTSTFVVTQRVLDFARVAVLFVLQEQQLNNAIIAQTSIQQFFAYGAATGFSDAGNLSLGNGNKIDFIDFSVNVGSGSVGQLTNNAGRLRFKRT